MAKLLLLLFLLLAGEWRAQAYKCYETSVRRPHESSQTDTVEESKTGGYKYCIVETGKCRDLDKLPAGTEQKQRDDVKFTNMILSCSVKEIEVEETKSRYKGMTEDDGEYNEMCSNKGKNPYEATIKCCKGDLCNKPGKNSAPRMHTPVAGAVTAVLVAVAMSAILG